LKTVFPSVADGLPIEVPNTDELWKYPNKSDQIFFPWEKLRPNNWSCNGELRSGETSQLLQALYRLQVLEIQGVTTIDL
jgi:hypothetical protein